MIKKAIRGALRTTLGRPSVAFAASRPSRFAYATMRILNNVLLSPEQVELVSATIREIAPCRLIVFGLGNDSALWALLNAGGRTVFLEDNEEWLKKTISRGPGEKLEAYLVDYGTRRDEWRSLLESPPELQLSLPAGIAEESWDIVLVDGPAGHVDDSPGRMKSIYTASQLVKESGDVFVHDCEREVENAYCEAFLGEACLVAEIPARSGLLRQYRVDSRS